MKSGRHAATASKMKACTGAAAGMTPTLGRCVWPRPTSAPARRGCVPTPMLTRKSAFATCTPPCGLARHWPTCWGCKSSRFRSPVWSIGRGPRELMDAALREGADVVGGIDPCAIDRTLSRISPRCFGLAEKHGKPIDIHLHEPGEMGAFSLDLILERTAAASMRGMVTISHGFCLGMIGGRRARRAVGAHGALGCTGSRRPLRRAARSPPLADCRAAGLRFMAATTASAIPGRPTPGRTCWIGRCISACVTLLRRDDELHWALGA